MNDLTRTNYTDAEIIQIERAAERRGREQASPHTIEPAAANPSEMTSALASAGAANPLGMASHAGMALSIGEMQARLTLLEERLVRLARIVTNEPLLEYPPAHAVASEPEPNAETERPRPIEDVRRDYEERR